MAERVTREELALVLDLLQSVHYVEYTGVVARDLRGSNWFDLSETTIKQLQTHLDAEQSWSSDRAMLLDEAREQAANHPSKDARHFAASVAEYLNGGGE